MFQELIVQFGTLAGVAALIAALVNVSKVFGLPDGDAPKVSAGLSLAAFIALVALKVFRPDVDVLALDKFSADAAVAVLYVLGFLVALGLPAKFHGFLAQARIPVLGKSYSVEKWDAEV
jgi:hypothetical protein